MLLEFACRAKAEGTKFLIAWLRTKALTWYNCFI